MTLAGLVASPTQWKQLAHSWRRTLKLASVTEFKASHCDRGYGEYTGWEHTQRDELRRALASVIDRCVPYAVAVSVVAEDYRSTIGRLLHRGEDLQDPYVWCMQSCLELIHRDEWGKRAGRTVSLVFDAGHPRWGRAQQYILRTRLAKDGWTNTFSSKIICANSRDNEPLQAADFIAYEMRYWTDKWTPEPVRPGRPDLSRYFKRLAVDGGFFDRVALRKVTNEVAARVLPQARETLETWLELIRDEREEPTPPSGGGPTSPA